MNLEYVPLTLANFAEGKLSGDVDAGLADILNRFASMEAGEIELASDKATISLKLTIERDPGIGGFRCSYEEPKIAMPKKVTSGVPAVMRDGVLVVATESDPQQIRLTLPKAAQE